MTNSVKTVYEDGVFKPLEPLRPDEFTVVDVVIPRVTDTDAKTALRDSGIDDPIGFIQNALPDMAEHHDSYLHSHQRE